MDSHCVARIKVAGCGYFVRVTCPMTRGGATVGVRDRERGRETREACIVSSHVLTLYIFVYSLAVAAAASAVMPVFNASHTILCVQGGTDCET